jgi:hypothetical protein
LELLAVFRPSIRTAAAASRGFTSGVTKIFFIMNPRATELRPLILLDLPATLDGFSERGEGP